MENPIKVENSTPLPQRQQRGNAPQNKILGKTPQKQNESSDGGPAEKKPRFNAANNQQNGGGGPATGGGGPTNQNKNFGNKGGFGGNRNRNRGGNQNRSNFPNQPNQKATNDVPNQDGGKPAVNANANAGGNQNQPNQNASQQQQQNQQQPQQQQQNQQQLQQQQNQQQLQQQQQNQQQQQQQGFRGRGNGGGGGGGGGGGNHHGGGGGGGGGHRDRSRGNRGSIGQNNSGGGGGNNANRSDDFFIAQRLRNISGPTHELAPVETTQETKFSGRNRLYVGNLTNDISDEELRELFKPYGEIGEIFSNLEKNFTFLKVDYHVNAEKAKRALDGTMRKGRQLRVRFAPNATILRVSNLTPFVSNELLYKSFEIFGPIERANITVDDRGKHTGEGIIEFAKKSSASACLRLCNEKCFFLTASLRPCLVEPLEINDDNDGLPEKAINKKLQEFNQERSIGPRFADIGSFEHEYGSRWKQLHDLYKTKQDALKRELKMEEEKLEAQMEYARYEHETELLRQELRKRESDNERKKMEWEMREKQAEEMRKREEETMRRQQNEMQGRMARHEEDMLRRQQENNLFKKAQQLNSMLDQQECFGGGNPNFENFINNSNSPFEVFRGNNSNAGNNGPGPNQKDAFAFEFGGNQQGGGGGNNNQRGNNGGGNNIPWERRRGGRF
ncbi:protein no-on-transient A isoform X2 [Scaptodrosophila lebanonensis]|uniref:Protein no-on-transient A n=1 Tax=Drosophila lebanonensis TaxID=7225 RepID=A0A6J2TXF9_DROLE|nr:protein no-on-transient A isoform X2 [Scaptodrosophila lebanonensis]